MISHLKDGWTWELKKDVASCDMLRVGACSPRSGDLLMRLRDASQYDASYPAGYGNAGNQYIQVPAGKESNSDSLTSSE